MTESTADPWAEGYRQAVLDTARALVGAPDLGDARCALNSIWQAATLGAAIPATDEALEAMGGREKCGVPPIVGRGAGGPVGQYVLLLDLLCAMAMSWPHEGSWKDLDALCEILGLRLVESPRQPGEDPRIAPDPAALPPGYVNPYAPDGVETWVPWA